MSDSILIADDYEDNRELLRLMLATDGYTILEARNGRECVSMARLDDLQRDSSVCNPRFSGDTAQVALQLDGAVVRVGLDPGDQATQRRDRFLDALSHAVGRPGDDGIESSDSAHGIAVAIQPDIVDPHVGLHAESVADPIAGRVDRDVPVVAGRQLKQKRCRAERHTRFILHQAFGGSGHRALGAVTGVQLTGEQAGGYEADHDHRDQGYRQRVAPEPFDVGVPGGGCSSIPLSWTRSQR